MRVQTIWRVRYNALTRRYERILVVSPAFSSRTYLGIWAEHLEDLGHTSVPAAGENLSTWVVFRHVVSHGHQLGVPSTNQETRRYRQNKLSTGRRLQPAALICYAERVYPVAGRSLGDRRGKVVSDRPF